MSPTDHRVVLDRVVRWATGEPTVRAMLLTSSQAIPDAPLDALSDYDVVLVVSDLARFAYDDRWLRVGGRPMVRLPPAERTADQAFTRPVLYADGTKVDFTLQPVAWLREVADAGVLPPDLDVGYQVLLDKDGLSRGLPPPSYRAYIPQRPAPAYRPVYRYAVPWARECYTPRLVLEVQTSRRPRPRGHVLARITSLPDIRSGSKRRKLVMEQERKVDVQPPAESAEEQVRETREFLETVSAERESTVPSAQDQGATEDADTLGDALPGAPD